MKVAIVCRLMPLYRFGLFKELSRTNEDFCFTMFGDTSELNGIRGINSKYLAPFEIDEINWIRTKNIFSRYGHFLWQKGIVRKIIGSEYKVFVFEGAIRHFPIWVFAILCKFFGKKVIFWTHGDKGDDQGIKRIIRFIFFKYLGSSLFLYGDYQKQVMVKRGFDNFKIFVIYNSLNPIKQFGILENITKKESTLIKQNMFLDEGDLTVIFVGRLIKTKGVHQLLQSVSILKKIGYLLNVIIIGDGPEVMNLKTFTLNEDLDKQIMFLGEIHEEIELARYFSISDIMISPGNVGLNCIHSLTYGVPVLTHDDMIFQGPEVESIKNLETGIFYERNNFDDLVRKIEYCCNNFVRNKTSIQRCQKVVKDIYNPKNQVEAIVSGIKRTLYN